MIKTNVYINGDGNKRTIVSCQLLKQNARTVIVQLPDGNIIKRKNRDIV